MASFSRGLSGLPRPRLLSSSRCHLLGRPVGPSRSLNTSLTRLQGRSSSPQSLGPTKSQVVSKPSSVKKTVAPSRYAFIKSLASKETPTVLYEAPSHFWFYFGCWSGGTVILGWTLLTGPTVVQQPDGIPSWVGIVYGTSYMLLAAMGFYLISRTPNIVRTIRLLPPGAGPASAAPRAAKLEVTIKRMVPFLRPSVVATSLDGVSLKSRLSMPEEYVPELRRLEQKLKEDEQQRRFDMQHLLTMPFRRFGRALTNIFRGVRAAWTDMGFGAIKVNGKLYKVDVTGGFAHDGFKTLEQIVHVEKR